MRGRGDTRERQEMREDAITGKKKAKKTAGERMICKLLKGTRERKRETEKRRMQRRNKKATRMGEG